MTTWPSLPDPLLAGFSESSAENTIRSPMDAGPAKVRRRTTANVRKLSFSLMLSTANVATLETFYNTTTSGGATAFDFTHPRTTATVSCRFEQPPSYTPAGNGWFMTAINLEQLP